MATPKNKKSKKKVIDGFVKNPRKEHNTKAPFADEAESEIYDKPFDDNTADEESPISISVNDTNVVITEDSEPDTVTADIDASELESETNFPKETDIPEEETKTSRSTISEPATEDLDVSSAILEEEVIDENLDDLINDIENNEEESDMTKSYSKKAATHQNNKSNEENAEGLSDTKSAKNAKASKPLKAKATAKPFRIISRILAIITLAATATFAIRIATTNIVPLKYLIPALVILALILIFYLFKSFRNKTRIPVLVILDLIGIAISAASIFGFIKIDETMAFLNKNFTDTKQYSIYNVIVNKKSSYNSLNDVKGKTFHSISDFVDTKKLEAAVKDQASATVTYADGITSLLKSTLDDNTYIALLNSGTYSSAIDGDNEQSKNYNDNLKIIGEIKVESTEETTKASDSKLTEESFVLYVSGIDTRSGLMLDRSLSDVNIVITVNPKTKNILMSTIPRDYYVQLHGTTGLPDKLTHAGSLGGVQLSMSTIGDLLNVNFDRYIRVNFNFVINLVDAIGGITVYSDVDYDITAHTDKSCTFHPGNNNVDGKCALAFARERYAYSDGDRHRGRNQEQVIEKIFAKVTSSSTLISKYSSILNALSGSFDTNISTEDITSLANMQLSDMAKWTVNTYNLDGSGGMAYTYSYPSQYLYVMYPDQTTVDTAKQKIQEVLTGQSTTNSENNNSTNKQ